jgi:hypothetical protein
MDDPFSAMLAPALSAAMLVAGQQHFKSRLARRHAMRSFGVSGRRLTTPASHTVSYGAG